MSGPKDVFLWDDDLKGFGLKVTPAGKRTYVLQYRLGGRGTPTRRWTIGGHGSPWTATTARNEAERLLQLVAQGIDLVEEARRREREAVALEFGAYLDTFRDGYLKTEWGTSWTQTYRQLEMYALPAFKGTTLPSLTKAQINSVFDALKSRPALARNVWAGLSKLMSWATRRGDIEINLMASMDPPSGAKARKRVLSDDEILAFWRATHSLSAPFGPFLRVLLITAQRRSEVAELPWSELNQKDGVWRLPGERAKNGMEHLVPLSSLANAELGAIGWKRRGLVFTTTGSTPISGFSRVKTRLDTLMLTELQKIADLRAEAAGEPSEKARLEHWRLHDLRRTGTTKLQRLGFPIEVTERVINHHQGGEASGIRGIYNLYAYQEEKTCALQAWADWLDQLVTGAGEASNVVQLASARA